MATTTVADARIVRRLWVVLVLYEMLVISIVAAAGLNISLAGGGALFLAAPLLLISCAEALRIPLSGLATRLRWSGKLLAMIALLAIAVGSAEGLAVAFEAFLNNRVTAIMHAAHEVERAKQVVAAAKDDSERQKTNVTDLTAQVHELDGQIATLAHEMPTPPAGSNRTCTGKKGARVTCAVDAAAANTYAEAMKRYNERLAGLTSQRGTFQAKVDAARKQETAPSPEAARALTDAQETFEEAAAQSPVWRLTAAVFREDVSEVTPRQFSIVKGFVTATLAVTFATLSMVASVVVHSPLRSDRSNKLSRMLRAMMAARRKTLRRVSEAVRTEYRDRTTFVYVPTDAEGRVLNPDARTKP